MFLLECRKRDKDVFGKYLHMVYLQWFITTADLQLTDRIPINLRGCLQHLYIIIYSMIANDLLNV